MNDKFSIGVDLGGTSLRVAAYTEGTEPLETIVLPTRLETGRDQVVRDMCGAIQALADRQYGTRRLAGIAVGTPGPLELPAGILRNPPNLPGWDGFGLLTAIRSTLGREITLENDANVAAFAEQRLGAGKAYCVNSLCVLTLGTGVGNGLVFNGAICHGATGMAGEAGHVVVQAEGGERCGCGGHGCLEQYASATAIVRMAREQLGLEACKSHEVALLARSGDSGACSVFHTVGRALGIALTGLINTLNLPLYLIGGGVCDAWDLFAPTMFRELHRRCYVYRLTAPQILQPEVIELNKTYILRAHLGPTAGLLGACLLGLDQPSAKAPLEENQFAHQ